MNSTERLDQIQARADAATDGPWIVDADDCGDATPDAPLVATEWVPYGDSHRRVHIAGGVSRPHGRPLPENAEFIAAARTDVPALVNALRTVLNVVGDWDDYDREYAAGEYSYDEATELRVAVRQTVETFLGDAS